MKVALQVEIAEDLVSQGVATAVPSRRSGSVPSMLLDCLQVGALVVTFAQVPATLSALVGSVKKVLRTSGRNATVLTICSNGVEHQIEVRVSADSDEIAQRIAEVIGSAEIDVQN